MTTLQVINRPSVVEIDSNTIEVTLSPGVSSASVTADIAAHNALATAHGAGISIDAAKYVNLEVLAAPTAPVAALDATAGNLNGAYEYVVTYFNGTYETAYSASSNTISPANQRGTVTIPVSSDATITTRRLYRTKAGVPNVYYFLFEIPDNSTTTYADNTADGSLGYDNHFLINTTRIAGMIYQNGAPLIRDTVLELAIGTSAGPSLWDGGYNNLFIGLYAGRALDKGAYHTILGMQAAPDLTGVIVGDTIIGAKAANSATSIEHCTIIGEEAARAITTGDYNTMIGSNAGYGTYSITTGDHCTYIGAGATQGSATQHSYLTVIGAGAGAEADADNRVVIGRSADSVYIPGASVGIGNSPSSSTTLYAFRTMTATTAQYVLAMDCYIQPTSDTSASYCGLTVTPAVNNASNLTGPRGAVAINAGLTFNAGADGYVLAAKILETQPVALPGATETIYGLTHIAINDIMNLGSITLYDNYGLKIENMTAGVSNFAIHTGTGKIHFGGLPSSSAGLSAGDLYNDSGTVKIVL